MNFEYNKPLQCGTFNRWLFLTAFIILTNYFLPLNEALGLKGIKLYVLANIILVTHRYSSFTISI